MLCVKRKEKKDMKERKDICQIGQQECVGKNSMKGKQLNEMATIE